MKNVALVVAGMVVGAGLSVATQQVFAQPARAPAAAAPLAPTPFVRWQQSCEPALTLQDANTLAAARGKQGFELVSFVSGAMCFNRPLAVRPVDPPVTAPPVDYDPDRDPAWPGY